MITHEERTAAIKKASQELLELYGSEEVTRIIKGIRTKHALTDDQIVDVIGDTILGLYTPHSLPQVLTEELKLSWKVVGEIMAELGELLDSLPAIPAKSVAVPEEKPIAAPQTKVTSPAPATPKNPEPQKPLTREELMKALEARRGEASSLDQMKQKLESAAQRNTSETEQ